MILLWLVLMKVTRATSIPQTSGSWALDRFCLQRLRVMEAGGRFHELIQWLGHQEDLNPRQQSALARAWALTGDSKRAADLVLELQQRPCDSETQCVRYLGQAALYRRQERWNAARFSASRALILARRERHTSLELDALFGIALALVETERPFLAIDCYQRIRHHSQVSEYRRGLATLNEMWTLWDIGRWRSMEALLPHIPQSAYPRVRLMLDMVDLRLGTINSWFSAEFPSILAGERKQIALLLMELVFLMPKEFGRLIPGSWLESAFPQFDVEEKSTFWGLALQAAQSGQPMNQMAGVSQNLDWRTQLERLFICFLSHLHHSPVAAKSLYLEVIELRLTRHGISTPLIPRWNDLAHPLSAWSSQISRALRTGLENNTPSSVRAVELSHFELRITTSENKLIRLDFKKRGQSFLALQLIAGHRGKEVTKEFIHQQLTGSRYFAHLHDDRIQKLYKRLERDIWSAAGVKLWCWPGQRRLRVLETIIDV